MKETKYIITKQSQDGRIYFVHIDDDKQLGDHISACFANTNESILGVLRVKEQ